MFDVEYVATDDEVESVASFNSAQSNDVKYEFDETTNLRRREMLNEFTRANGNGTLWSLNDSSSGAFENVSDDPQKQQANMPDEQVNYETSNTVIVKPKPVLEQLLVECENFYKSEMKKAEEKIFQQMLNGMKLKAEENAVKPTTDESACKCQKLKKKIEKLKLQLKAAESLVVPELQFSTKSINFVASANERTSVCISNFGRTRVAVRAYLVNELFPTVRIRPTELQIGPSEMRSVDLIWTGVQPSKTKSISNGPLSFSFKWTNVPEAGHNNDKECPLIWINEYQIRQFYITVNL